MLLDFSSKVKTQYQIDVQRKKCPRKRSIPWSKSQRVVHSYQCVTEMFRERNKCREKLQEQEKVQDCFSYEFPPSLRDTFLNSETFPEEK